MATRKPPIEVSARRIGLVADNHSADPEGADLPAALIDAFSGVDLIVHCGDSGDRGSLDRLESVAQVIAVTGRHNGARPDPRVAGTKAVLKAGNYTIGVIHHLPKAPEGAHRHAPGLSLPDNPRGYLARQFGAEIDILAIGGSHVATILHLDGVLVVNPGSPTLPADRPAGSLGTAAVLELGEAPSASVIDLAAALVP